MFILLKHTKPTSLVRAGDLRIHYMHASVTDETSAYYFRIAMCLTSYLPYIIRIGMARASSLSSYQMNFLGSPARMELDSLSMSLQKANVLKII